MSMFDCRVDTIRDNAEWIKESAQCLDNTKCQKSEIRIRVAILPQSRTKHYGCEFRTFLLHQK